MIYFNELLTCYPFFLCQAGEDQWGTDEADIAQILAIRSFAQLRATFAAYQTVSERTLIEAIENECSGTLQDGYLAIGKITGSLVERVWGMQVSVSYIASNLFYLSYVSSLHLYLYSYSSLLPVSKSS